MAKATKKASGASKKAAPKKSAAKKTAKGAAAKGAAKKGAAKKGADGAKAEFSRLKIDPASKLTVVGEHTRREGSLFYNDYEAMKKSKTVGDFLRGGGNRATFRQALKDKYIKVG